MIDLVAVLIRRCWVCPAATVLVEPIDRFFVDVLVMAEDPAVEANRLGLLATIRGLAADIIDWTVIN